MSTRSINSVRTDLFIELVEPVDPGRKYCSFKDIWRYQLYQLDLQGLIFKSSLSVLPLGANINRVNTLNSLHFCQDSPFNSIAVIALGASFQIAPPSLLNSVSFARMIQSCYGLDTWRRDAADSGANIWPPRPP